MDNIYAPEKRMQWNILNNNWLLEGVIGFIEW